MQEELDGACALDEQVVLAIDDRTVAALPDVLLTAAGRRAMTGNDGRCSDLLGPLEHDNMGNAGH